MSRIGKNPARIPQGVKATLEGNTVKVEGPKGKLEHTVHEEISVEINGDEIVFSREGDSPFQRSIHGTSRALVNSMLVGVSEGFSKTLNLVGVGYRAEQKGKDVNLILGFSHPVLYKAPEGIEIKAENNTTVVISGADKQKVGQVCAEIRKYRKPEPYKGKGILYAGEQVRRKQGKRTGK